MRDALPLPRVRTSPKAVEFRSVHGHCTPNNDLRTNPKGCADYYIRIALQQHVCRSRPYSTCSTIEDRIARFYRKILLQNNLAHHTDRVHCVHRYKWTVLMLKRISNRVSIRRGMYYMRLLLVFVIIITFILRIFYWDCVRVIQMMTILSTRFELGIRAHNVYYNMHIHYTCTHIRTYSR